MRRKPPQKRRIDPVRASADGWGQRMTRLVVTTAAQPPAEPVRGNGGPRRNAARLGAAPRPHRVRRRWRGDAAVRRGVRLQSARGALARSICARSRRIRSQKSVSRAAGFPLRIGQLRKSGSSRNCGEPHEPLHVCSGYI